jgi:CheY-like chemotaxis protein
MSVTRKKILCVEDHDDTCAFIAHVLRHHEVVGVRTKGEAIERATKESFDLYLLDQHLPDGTGLEVCGLIRDFDPDTPIFFCTDSTAITETKIKKAGAQRLIKKGADFVAHLRSAVSQIFTPESS